MNKTLNWKIFTVLAVTVWAVLYILPNFMDVSNLKYFPGKKVNYGLDIQGGIHLVMGVDLPGVITETAKRNLITIGEDLKTKGINVKNSSAEFGKTALNITVEFDNEEQLKSAQAVFEKDYTQFLVDSVEGSILKLRYNDVYLADLKKRTLEQSIETIRNRVDEFGVAEPSITAQGEDRILVQLPGIGDANQAKDLINRTARLEFFIVDEAVDRAQLQGWIDEAEKNGNYKSDTLKYSEYVKRINQDLKAKLPKDSKVLFEKAKNAEDMSQGNIPYVVVGTAAITGDDLQNAMTSFDEMNRPEVSMNFNPVGAKKFADVTEKSVGKLMAVVLDDVIYAAPSIRERIGGGNARITLGGRNYDQTMNEANMISMALRAGALPAKLEQLEERSVGPSLGQDSIDKAEKAIIIGTVLLLLFMAVWYKSFGILADIGLVLNGVLILAILSSFNATLTLPGVAGIALTLGMAVDANVIIYERIKEELQKGLTIDLALKEGYNKALSAILDSNITTIATAIILIYFGTGAVRGFGVTLIIGILTSMFSAIFFTRTLAEVMIYKLKIKKLAI